MQILVTRFNSETQAENEAWRKEKGWKGCIYGCCSKCSAFETTAIVLEMNNDTNRIEGLGIITHYLSPSCRSKEWRIYAQRRYNQHIYFGPKRIDLKTETRLWVPITEKYLFYGKGHSKRGDGLTRLPKLLVENNEMDLGAEIDLEFGGDNPLNKKETTKICTSLPTSKSGRLKNYMSS